MAYGARRKAVASSLASAILLVAASRLSAQAGMASPGAAKELTVSGSVSGGYDGNDNSTSLPVGLSPIFQQSTTHMGGDVLLQYSNPGRRMGWAAGVGSGFRLYQAADTVLFNHNAAIGASAALTKHISASATLLGSYSPPFQANLFPTIGQVMIGQAAVAPTQNSLTTTHLMTAGTISSLTYAMTKRTALTLGHTYRLVRLTDSPLGGNAQEADGTYHIAAMKHLGFFVGYHARQYEFDDPATGSRARWRAHNVDIGLDYGLGRGLKLSRRTTANIGFGLGSYLDERRNVRLTGVGHAAVSQQLFRTWHLGVGYSRGLGFMDGFRVPVFSDSFQATLFGQLSRRVSAYGSAYYSIDRFDAISGSSRYRSHRGIAGVQMELTRQLQGFVQYVNYHHAFPENALFLSGGLPTLNRQGISGGLTFVIPVIGNAALVPRRQP
jgi:hypothetical protein